MTELDIARHSRLIDPQLHIWGWEIPVYLFLGGMAAGLMILTALLADAARGALGARARWLAFAAPVLVSVGMGALFLDLAHKAHVVALLPRVPLDLAHVLGRLDPDRRLPGEPARRRSPGSTRRRRSASRRLADRRRARRARPRGAGARRCAHAPALAAGEPRLGVALGVYTGILLSTLGARALWSSALLGPLFLVSGLSTGAAFLLLVPRSTRRSAAS